MFTYDESAFQSDLSHYRELHARFYEQRNTAEGRIILKELAGLSARLDAFRDGWWREVPQIA